MYAPGGMGDALDDVMAASSGATNPANDPSFAAWLASGGVGPSPASCPSGSTCTIFPSIPNSAVYTLLAVLGGLVVVTSLGHR